ncbi:Actin T1-like protein [Rhynchospora pubera]|uniref:Actin T1-like protein n=1 Tax=Rhynchospora pubera TaxID=906938 RepID=A0AAV8HYA0_9POAL|nr:Actin T1-like protein [Rhynchospora pubera]KAJ4767489.1 Actin T1-like protein [Rhynchospora pubera]KAJ4796391.1 Actin T1-like protein [Rhynchospora pubera]KAJ4820203.1 Actin T1-like protein [Rhynchospora pubera]
MEKYFGNAYRGDPGVPHTSPGRFSAIWLGSLAFSAATWNYPYIWNITSQWNYHDRWMLHEQYHWKKALAKGEEDDYDFKWNKQDRSIRDSYYHLWPMFWK